MLLVKREARMLSTASDFRFSDLSTKSHHLLLEFWCSHPCEITILSLSYWTSSWKTSPHLLDTWAFRQLSDSQLFIHSVVLKEVFLDLGNACVCVCVCVKAASVHSSFLFIKLFCQSKAILPISPLPSHPICTGLHWPASIPVLPHGKNDTEGDSHPLSSSLAHRLCYWWLLFWEPVCTFGSRTVNHQIWSLPDILPLGPANSCPSIPRITLSKFSSELCCIFKQAPASARKEPTVPRCEAGFQNCSLPLVYHLAWLDRRRDPGTLCFEEIKYSWIVLFLSPLLTLVSLKNSSSQFYRDEMYVWF